MEQLLEVLQEIRDGIYMLNSNVEDLKNEITGTGVYNSLSDVCDKLDAVEGLLTGLTSYGTYVLSDVCNKLDSIDSNTM